MSQHDFEIANQGFPAFRSDLNNGLQALASNSAGATEPSTTYAYQFWYDETTDILKMRNGDDDAWITLAFFDQTNDEWEVRSAVIQAVDSAGVVIKTDDGNTRLTIADDGTVTVDGTLDVDTIAEKTGDAGVTIEGITIKDSAVGTIASPVALISDSLNGGQFGGRRNLIINGAMQVWQRGTSSTAVGSSNTYHADRFLAREDTDGGLTTERSTESPDNFKYSTKVTVTSADASLGAAQKAYFSQRLEGTVWDHLNFGTSAAQTVTLSFYVRSSLTGTFSGSLINDNNNRAYPWEYTINTADTWERKTITIEGDTTGTWDTGSSDWMELYWDLGLGSNFEGTAGAWAAAQDFGTSGSVKLIGTNGATWYITGVQLEVGSVATPFEHRSYGEELAACQRYYQAKGEQTSIFAPYASNDAYAVYWSVLPVSMRATPSGTISAGWNISLENSDSMSAYSDSASNYTLPSYTLEAEL